MSARILVLRLVAVLAGIFLFVVLIFNTYPAPVFAEGPKIEVAGEVVTKENVIGSQIVAVLRIQTPKGVYLDLTGLPKIGSSLGDLEIVGQEVRRKYFKQDKVVTEVTYTFLYLLPIDFDKEVTIKQVSTATNAFTYLYLGQNSDGTVTWQRRMADLPGPEYWLYRRVKEGDEPRGLVGPVPPPIHFGLAFLALAIAFVLERTVFFARAFSHLGLIGANLILTWVANKVRSKSKLEEVKPISKIVRNFEQWQVSGDYDLFKDAVEKFRAPYIKLNPVNPPYPATEFWFKVLSRVIYDPDYKPNAAEIKDIFVRMIREEGNV